VAGTPGWMADWKRGEPQFVESAPLPGRANLELEPLLPVQRHHSCQCHVLPAHHEQARALERALHVLDPDHARAVGAPRLEANAAPRGRRRGGG
jgi:hypothetical protein